MLLRFRVEGLQDKPFGVNLTILPALIPAELWPHMTIGSRAFGLKV